MGLHRVEWTGPKIEGLTLDLGDLTSLPTDLNVNNRHVIYSHVQPQVSTNARVDMIPVTNTVLFHLQRHHGRHVPVLPLLPNGADSVHHHSVQGDSRVDTVTTPSTLQDIPDSANHRVLGGSRMEPVAVRHVLTGVAGSERKYARVQSSGDSYVVGKDVLLPLLPGIAGPERGDLERLKVNVKIEKVEPEEPIPLSLPLRTIPLPTDLLPLESESVQSLTEPVVRPVTIELSDTESDGSVLCWNVEGRDDQDVSTFSSVPISSKGTLTGPESSQHSPSHSLIPNMDGAAQYPGSKGLVNPLKRKCSVIDLDSIIDLDSPTEAVKRSASEDSITTRGFSASESPKTQPESADKTLGLRMLASVEAESQILELRDGKSDPPSQQHGLVTELQVTSDVQMASDQQYVFDFARDDENMEELMFDDDEELEPEFIHDDAGDVDQDFEVSSFDTHPGGFIPNPKDFQEEVPSWYMLQARGSEELNRRCTSVNSQRFTYLGTDYSQGFEQGTRNAMHLIQAPCPSTNVNQQLVPLVQRSVQPVSSGVAQNLRLGYPPCGPPEFNVSTFCGTLPQTADAVQALCKFVQASNGRGVFQPPQGVSACMTLPITSQCAAPLHDSATEAPNSGMDSVTPSVVERDVADSGAVTKLSCGKDQLVIPKPEPVERNLPRETVVGGGPVVPVVKSEWPENNGVRPVVDNRESTINALKMFEQGRIQMLQQQVDSDPDGKRVRADLKVACVMRNTGYWLNESRPIGECPGVKVGDCFTYRIEMAIIGLHRAVQAGIAVVSAEHCPYGKRVAGSVVIGVNDTYKDDKDMGETVVYSGQGGLRADKSGIYQDQKLVRGNLALANSLELGLPVRLIRGHKLQGTSTGIVYSYDGLYKVVAMNYGVGVHKNLVYTFHMERIPGQPPIQPPSVAALLYPASVVAYPVPLRSHASLPSSSQVPPNEGQGQWIEQAHRSQGGTDQPSQPPQYAVGAWAAQSPNSQNPQSQHRSWTEEYLKKPVLYLLPRSSQQ